MQYKVPQGIDMQDRILGPLTMVQFGFILFGGLIAYFIFLKVPKPYGFWLALISLTVSLAFSFEYVRRMIVAAIFFIIKPRSRVWHKSVGQPVIIRSTPVKKKNIKPALRKSKVEDISKLAAILDKRGQNEQNQ